MTETRARLWVRRFLLEHLVGERNLARNRATELSRFPHCSSRLIAGKVQETVDQILK